MNTLMNRTLDYETPKHYFRMKEEKRGIPVDALQEKRMERHLSQQELSKRTKIAQGDISKIERGKANPSVKTLDRLAKGLGCELVIEFRERRFCS